MPLGSDSSVTDTKKFITTNNEQPVSKLKGVIQAGESEGGLFGTLLGTLGLGDNLTSIVKKGAEFKLKKELGLIEPKPKQVVTTVNKTIVKPDDMTATKVLETKNNQKNNLIYFIGGAGILVIAFALIAKGR